jgi:hypothetical protein
MRGKKRGLRDRLGRLHGSLPRMLTAAQLQTIRRGWRNGMSLNEIMRQAKISKWLLQARRGDQLRDLTPASRGKPGTKRGYHWLPSPEEIAREAQQLRADHLEQLRRFGGGGIGSGNGDLPATPRDDGSRLPARR